MAIGANSYGSVAEVAAMTPRYTSAGSYTTGTTPTVAQVEGLIDRVSGTVNVILAQMGFAIPVTQADVKLMLADFVVEQVVELCHGMHGAGLFAPSSEQLRTRTAFRVISSEAKTFIEENATGIENLGAVRTYAGSYGLAATLTGDDGETLQPFADFDPDTEPIRGPLVGAS
jgi:hypothetical protein